MFETFRDNIRQTVQALQASYSGFADSVEKFNQDLREIRDLFISIKNIVAAVFSFIGQETAILLFCTFLFLFVINMIPFFFLDKRLRYYIGVAFGVYLSFFFGYAALSLAKFVLIMFTPVVLEYLLVLSFKIVGKSLGLVAKKGYAFLKKGICNFFLKIFKKTGKTQENKKQF